MRPKEGECSPEYATSLKLVTGQDALSTQCLFTGTAEQSSKGWHAAHGCLAKQNKHGGRECLHPLTGGMLASCQAVSRCQALLGRWTVQAPQAQQASHSSRHLTKPHSKSQRPHLLRTSRTVHVPLNATLGCGAHFWGEVKVVRAQRLLIKHQVDTYETHNLLKVVTSA